LRCGFDVGGYVFILHGVVWLFWLVRAFGIRGARRLAGWRAHACVTTEFGSGGRTSRAKRDYTGARTQRRCRAASGDFLRRPQVPVHATLKAGFLPSRPGVRSRNVTWRWITNAFRDTPVAVHTAVFAAKVKRSVFVAEIDLADGSPRRSFTERWPIQRERRDHVTTSWMPGHRCSSALWSSPYC
jgi:hypothetical protein